MLRLLIPVSLLLLNICTSVDSENKGIKDIDSSKNSPKLSEAKEFITKDQLLGAWTDGTTENATFYITQDSIQYVDHLETFPYFLENDTITIEYPDMNLVANLYFLKDTLIINDPQLGVSKFTRFNH